MMIEKQVLKRFFPRSVPLTVERSAKKERPGSVLPFRDSDINHDSHEIISNDSHEI
jgi:hypothetical protein